LADFAILNVRAFETNLSISQRVDATRWRAGLGHVRGPGAVQATIYLGNLICILEENGNLICPQPTVADQLW